MTFSKMTFVMMSCDRSVLSRDNITVCKPQESSLLNVILLSAFMLKVVAPSGLLLMTSQTLTYWFFYSLTLFRFVDLLSQT